MGLITRVLQRFGVASPIPLPEYVKPCRWSYIPLKPYIILDVDPHAEAVLGLASTPKLNVACAEFAKRLGTHPVTMTHAVIDARDVVILGADPGPTQFYSGCAAAWLLMDRYLDPVDAAVYETWARETAPI